MKIILTITIIINFLFSQANYQILNLPSSLKEIFKYNKIEDNNLNFFHTSFPAQINFYSFVGSITEIFNYSGINTNNYKIYINFESIDYGTLKDNNSHSSFTANENLIKIQINKKLNRKINTMLRLGILESTIAQFNSNALLIDAMISYKFSNNFINAKIENFGEVIKKYTNSEIPLPSILSLSYIRDFNPVSVIINYEYDINQDQDLYSISSQFNINNNLKLYFSINDSKESIIYGNYIEELISGIKSGLSFRYSDYMICLAIQNMGAAGYSTSIAFQKFIL